MVEFFTGILEFIKENWQLLTIFFSFLGYVLSQLIAIRNGTRAMLRADLIRLYNKYHDEWGYCPIYVKQALEDEYKWYHSLKGNGVGTNLYELLMALPTEPPHER